ncbi:hypothetical protein [Phaeobacter gallaeciensis]|uniref:EamA domain-containing protein n=1 Tax=Phaeobacter gallaeciensis TaxID=60890 RepID=A0AAC9ZCR8_9RHOB|nr:hypothetical protein [Phaeobacter gallaeciensis]AHD11544.1 hypothetical protein Gal_03836 [Phaeobacter gallaeciensis DSM 26640]ATE94808.1 hypothetical protein PhaeoP11_03822 [Phaeobacter gallaeciensis]ATE99080.1 hypothetical protein PhaeoP73_03819 [Phaeobacter gallaeciensis]ATF03472.1 hypothetical protein PhaeoP75_03871 [Phaeobacter gallaeciensis]ATF07852.1 hypothetical protein PhaeoP63_03820 [Phaeobacter gallaeciensis]
MFKPIVVTVAAMFFWALLSVVSRILLLKYDLDPWMFSFIQLCAGGTALILLSGERRLDTSSFSRPTTWMLGALRVTSAAIFTAVLALISVLEAGLVGTLNLPVIMLVVWVMSGTRPSSLETIGQLLVFGAILAILWCLEADIRGPATWLMVLNAFCLAAITLLSERHPDNLGDQPGARARFTGAVLLVTATIFLGVRSVHDGFSTAPVSMPLLISSVAVGVFLRAPAMFFVFWSIRLVGAMRYTASVTLLPLFGLIFEQWAIAAGLLDVTRFRVVTLYLAVIIVVGTAVVLVAQTRRT